MPELAAEARRMNAEDGFDMNRLRKLNKERQIKKQKRQDQKALRRARRRCEKRPGCTPKAFDEAAWWKQREGDREGMNSDSTASTSSSSDSSSSSGSESS